jgi:hypothetical protein
MSAFPPETTQRYVCPFFPFSKVFEYKHMPLPSKTHPQRINKPTRSALFEKAIKHCDD